jgi:hypothetical protein
MLSSSCLSNPEHLITYHPIEKRVWLIEHGFMRLNDQWIC